jgi:hypothetical protein
MTTQTLSHLTLQTLDNYRNAANQAVVAYRLGSHRLVNVVNATLENSVYPRTAKLAPKATRRMDGVRGNMSDVVVKGIDQVAERTEQAIEMGSTAAAAQVKKAARFAAGIDNNLVASGLQTAVRLSMPGAKVALAVSGKVAEGASALAGAAGARPLRKAVRKASAKVVSKAQRQATPAVRRAKKAVDVTTKRVARVVKAKAAPVTAAVRRAPRAAKKVAAEVAAA